MSTTTTNMGLTKPGLTDSADITVLDTDMDIVDTHDHSNGKGVQIPTAGITDGAVTSAKIAAAAVGTTQIANSAITATQIAAGAVGTSQMATGAVTATQIAGLAVGTTAIADSAVTMAKLADGAATGSKLGSDVVTLAGNQALTNKTLTSPSLSAPTFSNQSIGASAGLLTYYSGAMWFADGSATHKMVSEDATQTLTNKTLTAPVLNGLPVFIAHLTASLSVPNAALTDVNTWTQDINQGSFGALSGATFTPNQAGYYLVCANAWWANNTTGVREMRITKNTNTWVGAETNGAGDGTNNTFQSASGIVYCNGSTDTLKVSVYQDSGGALNLQNHGGDITSFHVVKLTG